LKPYFALYRETLFPLLALADEVIKEGVFVHALVHQAADFCDAAIPSQTEDSGHAASIGSGSNRR
jgi:hypothetical protein